MLCFDSIWKHLRSSSSSAMEHLVASSLRDLKIWGLGNLIKRMAISIFAGGAECKW